MFDNLKRLQLKIITTTIELISNIYDFRLTIQQFIIIRIIG